MSPTWNRPRQTSKCTGNTASASAGGDAWRGNLRDASAGLFAASSAAAATTTGRAARAAKASA
eukprot:9302754-Alexandrium_andersonii.AAC.1